MLSQVKAWLVSAAIVLIVLYAMGFVPVLKDVKRTVLSIPA